MRKFNIRPGEAVYVFKRGKYGVKSSSGSSAAKKQKVADPASGKFA
jgi:hypothetical protein